MTGCRPRWRSKAVNLAMLGTAGGLMTGLSGCGQSGTFQRNVYNSMADCGADYALATCSAKGLQDAGRFLGPVYRTVAGRPQACNTQDPGGGPLVNSRRISVAVARGGFGVACRSSSARSGGSGGSSYRSWGG